MELNLKKSSLCGTVNIIPSKSYLHRAIICASLAQGKSVIKNIYLSDDIQTTIECCRSFGALIDIKDDCLEITGSSVKRLNKTVNFNESGSSMRFMIPIFMLNEEVITFEGKEGLAKRPLDIYLNIFDLQGIKYQKNNLSLPLTVEGKLKPGTFSVKGGVSSQFISGLLMTLPLLNQDSKVVLTDNLESKNYVDLTIRILKLAGIDIINNDYKEFIVKGNQEYKPFEYRCEGDYSQAAFFLAANLLGNDVSVANLERESLQGDKKILEYLKEFGSRYSFNGHNVIVKKTALKPVDLDITDTPDLAPILFTLAAITDGVSHFTGTRRLRIKESNRITSMQLNLEKIGAKFEVRDNDVYISGINRLGSRYHFDSYNDHRVAMSLIILSSIVRNVKIDNIEAINKTYPTFVEEYKKLGGVGVEFR